MDANTGDGGEKGDTGTDIVDAASVGSEGSVAAPAHTGEDRGRVVEKRPPPSSSEQSSPTLDGERNKTRRVE